MSCSASSSMTFVSLLFSFLASFFSLPTNVSGMYIDLDCTKWPNLGPVNTVSLSVAELFPEDAAFFLFLLAVSLWLVIGRWIQTVLWRHNLRSEWCILNLFVFLGLEIIESCSGFLLVSSPGSTINPLHKPPHCYSGFYCEIWQQSLAY